jgi:hypothetical protein
MRRYALIATLLLAGCVSSQTISCTAGWTGGIVGAVANASTSSAQCYQRAGELCGQGGHDILQQVGEGSAMPRWAKAEVLHQSHPTG